MKRLILAVVFVLFMVVVSFAGVNINTADLKELTSLPGIGSVKAVAIVDYRTKHGNFTTTDDLKKVNGIGGKTMEKLRDLITVDVE